MMNERDTATIEALLARADWARGLARRLVRDEALADDVVQSAYLAALEKPPKQDAGRDAWLRRVIRNVALATRRSDSRREKREVDRPAPWHPEPTGVDQLARMEMHRELSDAVLRLDEPYRTVVIERYYEGRSSESIAAAAGIPSATVRNQLKRGLDRLRSELDGKFGSRAAWIPGVAAIGHVGAETTVTVSAAADKVAQLDVPPPGSFATSTSVRVVAALVVVTVTAFVVSRLGGSAASPRESDVESSGFAKRIEVEEVAPMRTAQTPRVVVDSPPPADASFAATAPVAETQPSLPPSLIVRAQLADGTPAAGCRIRIDRITTPELESRRELRREGAFRLVADEEGLAVVERMEEGRWIAGTLARDQILLVPGGDGDLSAIEDVPFWIDNRSVTREVTLIVRRGVTIRGRVVGDAGQPLEGCDVSIRWGGPDPIADGRFESCRGGFPTDADGVFEIFESVVRDEPYALVVRHRNYDDDTRLPLDLESGGELDLGTLCLTDVRRGSVLGKVHAVEPRPVRVQVFDTDASSDERPRQWCGWPEEETTLQFHVHGLAPGDYELRIDGRPDVIPIGFHVSAGDLVDVGTIRLAPRERTHRLFGTVVDIDGQAISGATVDAAGTKVVTADDGTFEIGAPDAGPYEVVIGKYDHAMPLRRRFDSVLFDGSTRVFELKPRGIRFDFVDAETGDPIPWERVGIHEFSMDRPGWGLRFTQRDLGFLDEVPYATSLREENLILDGASRFGFVIYVDGYEAAEVAIDVPEDVRERELRIVVPLHKL